MSDRTEPDTRPPTSFERFTRALLSVPLEEVERERAKYDRGGDHRRKKPQTTRRGSEQKPSR